MALGPLLSKTRVTWTQTLWPISRLHIQHGYAGQKHYLCPRQGKAGQRCDISSYHSEWHTTQNIWIVHFWYFPSNILKQQLTTGNWNHEKQNHEWGGGWRGITVYPQKGILLSKKNEVLIHAITYINLKIIMCWVAEKGHKRV